MKNEKNIQRVGATINGALEQKIKFKQGDKDIQVK